MYAVAEISGKQYILEEGKSVEVDRLGLEDGAKLSIDKVCLVKDGNGKVTVGEPFISGVVVKATVDKEVKGKKVVVSTYRKRKDSKRKKGHRAKYSRLNIEKIEIA